MQPKQTAATVRQSVRQEAGRHLDGVGSVDLHQRLNLAAEPDHGDLSHHPSDAGDVASIIVRMMAHQQEVLSQDHAATLCRAGAVLEAPHRCWRLVLQQRRMKHVRVQCRQACAGLDVAQLEWTVVSILHTRAATRQGFSVDRPAWSMWVTPSVRPS